MTSIAFIPHKKGDNDFDKLNWSLIKDLDYNEAIKETIETTAEIINKANHNLSWDTIKMAVWGESKDMSLWQKELNNKTKHCEEKIQNQQDQSYKEQGHLKILEELKLAKIT